MSNFCKALILLFIPIFGYSQNFFIVAKSANRAIIKRTITVPKTNYNALENISYLYNSPIIHSRNSYSLTLNTQIRKSHFIRPSDIVGPYNYDRLVAKLSRQIYNNKEWQRINKTTSYNGAHHLIMKSTINLIYQDLKELGIEVNLQEIQKNAPSIFHYHHGDPKYNYIFHNADEQYEVYKRSGMKILVLSQLTRIDLVNQLEGLEHFSDDYIRKVLAEAELWCNHYHMRWK